MFNFSYTQACDIYNKEPELFKKTADGLLKFELYNTVKHMYYVYSNDQIKMYRYNELIDIVEVPEKLYSDMLDCFYTIINGINYDIEKSDLTIVISGSPDENTVSFSITDENISCTYCILYCPIPEYCEKNELIISSADVIAEDWYYYSWGLI